MDTHNLQFYTTPELIAELETRTDYDMSYFDTSNLISELERREEDIEYDNNDLTSIYYALRDRNIDKVIELINPMLWKEVGRKV